MITSLNVTVVVNNFISRSGFKGEHGLSLLIDMDHDGVKTRMLWDTGQSPETLLVNLNALKVELSEISTVAISHGHYDHVGGLLGFLDHSSGNVQVLVSQWAWGERLNNSANLKPIGIGFTSNEVTEHGGLVVDITQPYRICEQVTLSGPIKRIESCEVNNSFLRKTDQGLVVDTFQDDMSLVLDLGHQGLFIITGCCHSGIINTVEHCMKITGNSRLKGIIGGLHLINADEERMVKTRNFLRETGLSFLAPLHCSGLEQTCYLRGELGESVKFLGAGEIVKVV